MERKKILDVFLLLSSIALMIIFTIGAVGAVYVSTLPEELGTIDLYLVTIDEGYFFGIATAMFLLYIWWVRNVPIDAYTRLSEGGD